MKKVRQIMSLCLVVFAGGFLQYVTAAEIGSEITTGWESERSLADGIQPRMGRGISNTAPAIAFDVMGDGKWTMICGELYGKFFGYYWDGGKWIPDRSRVNGLKDIGGHSAPAIVPNLTGEKKWTLIARNSAGKFFGYCWDGTKWASDQAAVKGLDAISGRASIAIMKNLKGSGKWTLISGNDEGTFKGFCRDGAKWVSDASIVAGLKDVGSRSKATAGFDVFGDKKWILIAGNSSGLFTGYYWDGARWVADPSRARELGDGRKYDGDGTACLVCNLRGDKKWVLIVGYEIGNRGFFCDRVSKEKISPVKDVAVTPLATAGYIRWKYPRTWNHRVRYSVNKDMSDAAWSDWHEDSNSPEIKLHNLAPQTTYYYEAHTYVPWDIDACVKSPVAGFTTPAGKKHIRLKPGESIPDAIYSLAPKGGTVELLPGVHNVHKTIVINRNNVTIQGTHASEIRANDPTKDVFAIPHENPLPGEPWKKMPVLENFVFEGFKVTSTFKKGRSLIHAWNVRNVTVVSLLNTSYLSAIIRSNTTGGSTSARSKNIIVRHNTILNSNVVFAWTQDIHVLNNSFKGPRSYIHIDRSNKNIHVIGNKVDKRGGGYACIVMDTSTNYKVRDNVLMGGHYGIRIAAGPRHILITNNTITEGLQCGIQINEQWGTSDATIKNNRIYNNKGPGILAMEHGWSASKNTYGEADVTDNIIYGNAGDGIKAITGIRLNIMNNIIAGNKGFGVSHTGTGKRACKLTLTGNNVWNNKAGKYSGVPPGKGDISEDPLFADPAKGDFTPKKAK